jgi:hypothetical protein
MFSDAVAANPISMAREFVYSLECECLAGLVIEKAVAAVAHLQHNLRTHAPCDQVLAAHEFFTFHGAYPTEDELVLTLDNMQQMNVSADRYCVDQACVMPAPGIEHAATHVAKQCADCAICLDTAPVGSQVLTLPCGHTFHGSASECLDGKDVLTWLRASRRCPVCRADVRFPAGQPDSKKGETAP